eukprot:gene9033-9969_t
MAQFNSTLRVVVFIHVAKKNFHTRLHASNVTWLTNRPKWADVYLFNLVREGAAPMPMETILIDSNEHGHNSNEQYFKTLKILFDRYKGDSAAALKNTWYVKLDDDSYVHWPALHAALFSVFNASDTLPRPLYYGNCGCKTTRNICKIDPMVNCTLIYQVPSFDYICGGSGILLNHELTRRLLDYELSVGCPYSLEDITVGHCILTMSKGSITCTDNRHSFRSLNNIFSVRHYNHVRHDPAVLGEIAIWETSYKNEVYDMHELWSYYYPKTHAVNKDHQSVSSEVK